MLKSLHVYLRAVLFFLAQLVSAKAAVVNATWSSATDMPVTASSYTATGNTVNFTLSFAPPTGTNLTVVNNTGMPFISGTFSNLAQGQAVTLSYNGVFYPFVAHYYGGTGNDLVLVWASNRVFAWGDNASGEIGDGTTTVRRVPTPVTATGVLAGKTIVALAAGLYHSLALCSDGTLAAWGDNTNGALGDGTTTQRTTPVLVNTASGASALYGKTVVAISAGYRTSLALCSDGTVAAWGLNFFGELGDNTNTDRSVPVAVNTTSELSALFGKTVTAISAGQYHNLALCSDGTLVSWGSSSNGQLGINVINNFSSVPVLVSTASGISALYGKTVTAVAAGGTHSLVLCSDGTIAAWGSGYNGELGDNNSSLSALPVAVNVASGVSALYGKTPVSISTGLHHNAALCSDGSVVAWGYNAYSQIGDNGFGYQDRYVPVNVNAASGVSVLYGKTVQNLSLGIFQSAALCTDGTIATWGSNGYGALGNNSNVNSSAAVAASTYLLATGERFVQVAGGCNANHMLALVATPPPPPVASTLAASGIISTGATLNGTANASNNVTTVSFEYGTTTAYGSIVAATPATLTDATTTAESADVINLAPGTLYHYRIKAVSGAGATYGADMTFTTLSNDASLGILFTSDGTLSPDFDSGTTSYTLTLPYATTSVSLLPFPSFYPASSSVVINGQPAVMGFFCAPIPLNVGSNIITAIVTAEDGTTQKTYTITASRAAPSTNAMLGSLTPSIGSLSPSFSSSIYTYHSLLDSSVTSITLTPVAVESNATITVNGVIISSGSTSAPISLISGSTGNLIPVIVTAQDGYTMTHYNLYVLCLNKFDQWRMQAFGTSSNSGTAADTADYDGDGICNLLEYALNLSPITASKLPMATNLNGSNFEYTYTRSTSAVNAGTAYTVEWSPSLSAGSWRSAGVSQTVLSDDGTTQQVKAVIPLGAASSMFVHLSVTAPP